MTGITRLSKYGIFQGEFATPSGQYVDAHKLYMVIDGELKKHQTTLENYKVLTHKKTGAWYHIHVLSKNDLYYDSPE